MKQRTIFCLVIFCLLASQASAQYQLSEAEKRWLAEREEVVFAGQISYPPFEFIHPRYGDYTGMSIDLIRWIATEYGFTTVFRPMPFAAAQQAVVIGTADAMTGIFESEERRQRYDFSDEVFAVPASIFVHAERNDIIELLDLDGKRVAVQRGDYAIEYLGAQNIEVDWVYTTDFQTALAMVAAREADALIGDEQIVYWHLYSASLTNTIKKVATALYIGSDCMAVAKGNSILLSILQKGLRKAKATGVLRTIGQKWLGVSFAVEEPGLDRWRWPLIIGLALMAPLSLGVLLWTMQLRRLVRSKTTELQNLNAHLRQSNESLSYANSQLMKDMEERARLAEEGRRLEARMIKAQSHESLALMAGNIAHDFNNSLMGIIAAIDSALALQPGEPLDETTRQNLASAGGKAKSAGELARRMLEFAGQSSFNRVNITLNELLRDVQPLLAASTAAAIEIINAIPDEAIAIKGDPGQIKQAILNLLINAVEASAESRLPVQLTLWRGQLAEPGRHQARAGNELPPDEYAHIRIQDTGSGIDRTIMERLFDPYYTTKRAGRGLGLAAAAGIIKAHGGAITVESDRHHGSCFTIILPLVEPAG
ncbi:MAG: hypothetical protein A2087_02020 [Spirochaetes bacterium GWD1_61_31]|nr:MAG: hypothetical protein A2Y37_11750 [Spirochaetes bacterium GWB1_60_80]OHD29941.1 MAG: hypothetical protein A2004_11990 [Spirochaetes bacterium GWC1_61_12]OHD43798.1 MAG: hypothetical protein A2087_02020 [Spirochaetes bacterium GWD1_61_31]OHD46040.1 MAG: hypothetical protein A2Y35_13575 [Spirochaetes bacterium GWE1_60_18]OHD60612.1 MAG: hypothetical protein A2Y32_08065 [Spirochaetes bacterium GWF1_60_12]HAP43451.1 hypothetical protein [Spirochaetaceae bacterium]